MNTKLQEVILLFLKPDFLWKPGLQPQEFALNIAAILDMEKDFNSGFLFGLDNSGRLIGAVSAGGEWKKCISEQKLEMLTWTHVAMTFSSTQGNPAFYKR